MSENKELAPWHEELINYLINPDDNRTYRQFAESVGISDMTLWRYRRAHAEAIQEKVKKMQEATYNSMRPVANKALARNLQRGDAQSLKLFYQLAGDLIERSEVKTEVLSIEQKRERIAKLLESLPTQPKIASISYDVAPCSMISPKTGPDSQSPTSNA